MKSFPKTHKDVLTELRNRISELRETKDLARQLHDKFFDLRFAEEQMRMTGIIEELDARIDGLTVILERHIRKERDSETGG